MNNQKIAHFIRYTFVALVLATALHFFNGYVMMKILSKDILLIFIYDVFSIMAIIMFGIVLTHIKEVRACDYTIIIGKSFFIALVSMIILSLLMFLGLDSFIPTRTSFHVFGILFIAVAIMIGMSLIKK